MTARPILQYAILLISAAGMIAAAAVLYESRASKAGIFIFRERELVNRGEARLLDPILDVKMRILADYPVSKLNRSRDTSIQQVSDLETLRSVYYNLFIQSDWTEIRNLFGAIRFNKSLDLQSNDQIITIVDILDSTLLAAAYLYERLNMNEAASYYYSLYLDCLRPVSFSSPGAIDRLLGKRLMVSRLKYYYLKDYIRYMPPDYPRYSYLNEVLDDALYFVMNARFPRYLTISDSASPYDLPKLIQKSNPRATPFLKYEYCASSIRNSNWSEDDAKTLGVVCAATPGIAKDDYEASFTSAAHIFFQMRWYAAEAANSGTFDSVKLAEIDLAVKRFYEQHAKEAEFLVDDMKIKYAMLPGNESKFERIVCEVSKYPFPNYDFALYAKDLVKERSIKCD